MSFCEHCSGQRFDRAQVLRALREVQRSLREEQCSRQVDEAMTLALKTVLGLEIPHLYVEPEDDPVVH